MVATTSAGRVAVRTVLHHEDLNLLTLQAGRSDLYCHFGLFDAHLEVAWIKLASSIVQSHILSPSPCPSYPRMFAGRREGCLLPGVPSRSCVLP